MSEDALISYLEQVAQQEQKTTLNITRKAYRGDDDESEDDDEGWD